MENNNNHRTGKEERMDDLFRGMLGNQQVEPSGSVWKGIRNKLLWQELIRFNFTNVNRLVLTGIATGILLVTATVIIFWPSEEPPSKDAVQPGPEGGVTTQPPRTVAPVPAPLVTREKEKQAVTPVPAPQARQRTVAIASATPGTLTAPVKPVAPVTPAATTARSYAGILKMTVPIPDLFLSPGTQPLDIQPVDNPSTPPEFVEHSNGITQFFSVGINIEPRIIFYKTNHSYSDFGLSGGIDFRYQFGRFFIRPGIAFGYYPDEGQYRAEYMQYDSVGFYNEVISFQTENDHIVYNTVQRTVYDSLIRSTTVMGRDMYYYIQVPLLLGYKAVETKHFNFSFQVGPCVSFLVGKKEPLPDPYFENSRVISLTRQTPDRTKTNWQIWAGFTMEFMVARDLSINVEPTYRYSLSPITLEGEIPEKYSQSVGLNIGLQYNFGYRTRKP